MTTPGPNMMCVACLYYETEGSGHGECRRYAPSPNSSFYVDRGSIGLIKTDVHWPKVYDKNWCGEFAQRQQQ